MRFFLIINFVLLMMGQASAYDQWWNYSSDNQAKTRAGYYTKFRDLQVQTEVINYNRDYASGAKGLDFLRSNFIHRLNSASELQTEIQNYRDSSQENAQSLNSFVRHRYTLANRNGYKMSLTSQLMSPVSAFNRERDGYKATLGMPMDFYHSSSFSAGFSPMLEQHRTPNMINWEKKILLNWYMNLRVTQKLATNFSLYADKLETQSKLNYTSVNATMLYDMTKKLKFNLGTWAGGPPSAHVYNTFLGASLFF